MIYYYYVNELRKKTLSVLSYRLKNTHDSKKDYSPNFKTEILNILGTLTN